MRLPFALRGAVDAAWLFVTLTPLGLLFVGFPAMAVLAPPVRVEHTTTHHMRALPGVQWPVSTRHPLTSGFGWRTHPTLGGRRFHNGVDIAVPIGTPVHAAASGIVSDSGEDRVSGRWLSIRHSDGVETTYCHLDKLLVQRGQVLWGGTTVAYSGNTGRSTGPHLHWIVRVNGRSLDPITYYRRRVEEARATPPPRLRSRAAGDRS